MRDDERARLSAKQGLHTFYSHSRRGLKYYNRKGKNPGDVVNFNKRYWYNFLLGNSHPNGRYKQALEIMEKWMTENNCYDYARFYEWYKKQLKGNWKSGNLEKGQGNKLSGLLPFPKPESRLLGKNPGDTLRTGFHHGSSLSGRAVYREGQEILPHPNGANPGDFWRINTRPFKGAHFAVFPEELCLLPVEAACPQWVCKKCGKPRKRIVRPTKEYAKLLNKSWTRDTDRDKKLRMGIGFQAHTKPVACTAQYQTVGWSDCGCNAGFRPGIVLDPFVGSGTACAVAKKLGRGFIGIDISPNYCRMARKRIKDTQSHIMDGYYLGGIPRS